MGIENIMFLALGFLAAGLLAIGIIPAIVRRAVRLTRRRIEAATPMTLNEFRADKDKLRAEFAIASRRAELQRERLRDKIAAQAVSFDTVHSEVSALRTERDEQFDAIRAQQNHLEELKRRIDDVQAENRDLLVRMREAERTYPSHSIGAELDSGIDLETRFDPETLSGHYEQDVEDLLMALGLERQRADLYRGQVQMLVTRLDANIAAGPAEVQPLADFESETRETGIDGEPQDDSRPRLRPANNGLDLAQARIESAESRLAALLGSTGLQSVDGAELRLLAEELSQEDDLASVHDRVDAVQSRILSDYKTRRFQPDALRAELETIASGVSAIVYAADSEEAASQDQSLFDRIRKFAGDTFEPANSDGPKRPGAVADRIQALRDLRAR